VSLDFDELRKKNVSRCNSVFHSLESWTPTDWATAFAGEAGEACNAVKKLKRFETKKNTAKDPQTEDECIGLIGLELADTIIYADLLAARLGIDLGEMVRLKFNKVSELYHAEERL
jgi:NTP pyrophosphatase (non-canonical NTP hydrolase)